MGKRNTTVDDDTLLALQEHAGKNPRQIEAIVKTIDHSTIARRLKRLNPRQSTTIFKEHKADILAEKQRQLLTLSTNPKTKKKFDPADHKNIAVAFGIYADKESLLRGINPEGRPMVIINKISINKQDNDVIDVTNSISEQVVQNTGS